jgi:UDP-glucuronate 4-epimerase
MTYLVTGGAGFVGSHVARTLLERGDSVVVIDNFNDYYDPAIKRSNAQSLSRYEHFTLVEGDIRDADLIQRIFGEHSITHVAHMAAMAGVRNSVTQVKLYMDVNTGGSMNLFEAARDHNVSHLVIASTSSVYGKTERLPFVETDPADRPLAAYPASKRSMELLAHTYHNLFGINFTILRFFNVYGPAGRPDMMPMRLMQAAVDGTVIPLFNDGELSRDWTYIDDTVQGVITALDKPLGFEIMNLGKGGPISMREFVDVIEELSGRKINTRPEPAPLSEPPITFCDNTKIRQILGFAPDTPVHEGLRRTWEWFAGYYGV